MSFGGHVAAMVASMKNNNALKRQRRSYFDNKIALEDVSDKMKIPLRKATPEQLRLIRAKLMKQRFYTRLRVFVVLLILSPFVWMVFVNMWGVVKEEIPKSEIDILIEYYDDIKKGDDYFNRKQFDNARTLYDRADYLIPNSLEVRYRKALASTAECFYSNQNCGHASWLLKELHSNENKDSAVISLNEFLVKSFKYHNPGDSVVKVENENIIFNMFYRRPSSDTIRSFDSN